MIIWSSVPAYSYSYNRTTYKVTPTSPSSRPNAFYGYNSYNWLQVYVILILNWLYNIQVVLCMNSNPTPGRANHFLNMKIRSMLQFNLILS